MTTTESYGCDKHGEDAYQGCAMCDLETLRERLHEAELVAASWKREAELNEQAARDVLRECLPYINESMAGRRPGRCADDIRAAVKALTADSGDERNG